MPTLMPLQLELTSVSDLVASMILCYDYLLTWRREVDFFWTEPHRSWMFALFVANRYFTILARVPVMVVVSDCSSCKAAGVYEQITILIVQIVGAVIMIIRVYALYQKSRRVLVFLVSIALAAIGIACVSVMPVIMATGDNHDFISSWAMLGDMVSGPFCHPRLVHLELYQPLRRVMDVMSPLPMINMAIAWSGQMMFDAIVFVLTLRRTLHIGRLGRRTLSDVIIRDGVLYFGLMTSANVANIAAFLVGTTSPTKSLLAGFTSV
ncbi:hypothetical protein M404DRAFT_10092 [Pisolithus tinctorius Marx 270]|uniref:DUF6533 domain-containing protein n=1 Tax=Pisolithus tinctorius Marx 270 TaxID=870435 RepID=A0A0C3P0R7_PISTI|nr:hypothetical protein M404DRAFT_10092 [Pisolithus tinctorius Marx 270]